MNFLLHFETDLVINSINTYTDQISNSWRLFKS